MSRRASLLFFSFRALCGFLLVSLLAADCPVNRNKYGGQNITSRRERNVSTMISEEELKNVFENSMGTLKERYTKEDLLAKNGGYVKERKSDSSLNRLKIMDPEVRRREMSHHAFEEASYQLYKKYNLTGDEMQQISEKFQGSELTQKLRDTCTKSIKIVQCDKNAKFRTANGQCNNLQNPTYGSAMACQQRLMPAHYSGISGFRESVLGGPLPPPRKLSLSLHHHINRPWYYVTNLYVFFGQVLDHDMVFTPQSTTADNEAIECCPPKKESNSQCKPIRIEDDDPFYSKFGKTCLNFVRSAVCATCNLGPRVPMNQLTSFIDGSMIYGNSENETAALRKPDGYMDYQTSKRGEMLLPPSPDPEHDRCSFPATNEICFKAGDIRCNQHPGLTSLHTIFLRSHNWMVKELSYINPHWDGDRLFQEARRINGACIQEIAYNEFMPITLGRNQTSYYNLGVGATTKYDPGVNPTMSVEFTTAAFRYGHTLINSVLAYNIPSARKGDQLLRNIFFQPFELQRGYLGPLMKGASHTPAQWYDPYLVPDVTNYMYRLRGEKTGLDLAAFNIYRGRDHGLPPYVDVVKFCSKDTIYIKSFSDLEKYYLMGYEQSEALKKSYGHVKDIDCWPGMLMETPREGAVIGPTAACIVGIQFNWLKYNDRFYFEHENMFTYQQRQEIYKTSLSQMICKHTNVQSMTQNAMIYPNQNNLEIPCSYMKGLDLSYWRD